MDGILTVVKTILRDFSHKIVRSSLPFEREVLAIRSVS